MVFIGITKVFSLKDENQYETIGNFWDETAKLYGMENLQGLGYKWKDGKIFYAIGLKNGIITLKRNENEFSLLRRCRHCFSTEKRVSVEKLRKNALASKHFYLYYRTSGFPNRITR